MLCQRLAYLLRGDCWSESLDGSSGPVDEELGEVPRDFSFAIFVGQRRRQVVVEIAGIIAIDHDLREHREVDAVLGGRKFEDFRVGSRLLGSELVARKTENGEAIVILVKCMQTCILRSQASLAREIDDQADLVLEIRQSYGFALDRGHLEIVHVRHLNFPPVSGSR